MARTPRRRETSNRHDLVRIDPRRSTPEQLSEAVHGLLDQSQLPRDERLHALASALVVEALEPYWTDDRTPDEAHRALRRTDPELAEVIEALAPMLLGHIEMHEEARSVISSVEALLGLNR